MKIRQAAKDEVSAMLEKDPYMKNVMWVGENTLTLFAVDDSEKIIAMLFAFYREIPAPLNGQTECFINVVGINDETMHGKGIGSALVQEAIRIAKEANVMQVRAYCDINNAASHMLWLKNGFGISPVKSMDGQIPGSFVTYRIN